MHKEQLVAVISDYYKSIGVEPDYTTRKSEQSQSRAAMMCALKDTITATDTGRLFGKNHATVLHHKRCHDANMDCWDGYKEKYEIARSMVNINLRSRTVQSQIARIEDQIKRLRISADELRKSIQLNNQDE
jgi:hypothetical protein